MNYLLDTETDLELLVVVDFKRQGTIIIIVVVVCLFFLEISTSGRGYVPTVVIIGKCMVANH